MARSSFCVFCGAWMADIWNEPLRSIDPAAEAPVEVLGLLERGGLVLLHQLVRLGGVARVAARIGVLVARVGRAGHRAGVGALLLDAGKVLVAELLQLGGREGGLPQRLG